MIASRHTLQSLRPLSELASGREHGDRLRYMAGCRCSECRRANSRYENARAAARRAGDWNGIVPAKMAREHIARLSVAGIGRRQVADASGVAKSIVSGIARGDRPNLRASTERAILAVTKEAAADHALTDAGPTWKLLDDLIATGYTKAHLARELGYKVPALQIRRTQCTVRTAYQVTLLHKRLRRVPAKAAARLIDDLRAEGYRQSQIEALLLKLAQESNQPAPDARIYGGFINADAADLLKRLHLEMTGEAA